MITKSKKKELFEEYNEIFKKAPIGILLELRGVTVGELTTLRMKLHKEGSALKILKNRVAKKATEGTPFEPLKESLVMSRALVYNYSNPVSPAKALTELIKKNDKITLIQGIFVSNNKAEVLSEALIKELGSLPSREELLAKLLFLFNAPITKFVRTLNEIPASFARVIQAVADKKGGA